MKKLTIALLLPLVLPIAFAGTPRTVDMTHAILDVNGKPWKDFAFATKDDPDCKACPVLTVGTVVARALTTQFPDEKDLPGDQKWARALLANRIQHERAAVLTVKEAETIERLVEKAFTGEIIAQVVPLIDPNKKPPELE